jgi:carbon monoxide dehydrogenase subunit G
LRQAKSEIQSLASTVIIRALPGRSSSAAIAPEYTVNVKLKGGKLRSGQFGGASTANANSVPGS